MDSSGDRHAPPEGAFAPFEVVGPIGSRPGGAWRVRAQASGGAKESLLIAEHFAGAAVGEDGQESTFVREARRIAVLTNLNVARVQSVAVHGKDVAVYGEPVEGERLVELWAGAPPLEVTLRWILDVLSGLATLHTLRDAKQQPLKLAHGEVGPTTVAIGVDGVARLLHSVGRRAPGAQHDPASTGYMAPEVLAGEPYDARADVFGAGVLLWEALAGKRLFDEPVAAAVVARVREGGLATPAVAPKSEWAKGLADVAMRAIAASPDERFPTAAAMAAELRKGAGLKLAPASTAATFSKSALGERVRARAERWAAAEPTSPSPAAPAAPPPPKPESPPAPKVAAKPAAATPIAPPADEVSGVESLPPSAVSDLVSAPAVTTRVEAPAPGVVTPRVPAVATTEATPAAPATPASPTSVVELGSESLLDAPDSVPPPSATPASALGGFVIDPFASGGRRGPAVPFHTPTPGSFAAPGSPNAPAASPAAAHGPAPLPPPDISPGPGTVEESSPVSGAPAFAAAISTPDQGKVEIAADVVSEAASPRPGSPAAAAARRLQTVRIRKADARPTLSSARPPKPAPSPLKTILLGAGAGLVVVVVGMAVLRPSAQRDTGSTPATKAAAPPPIESPVTPSASGLAVTPPAAEPTQAAAPAPPPAPAPASPAPEPSQATAAVKAPPVAAPRAPAQPKAPPPKKRTTFTPDTL